MTDIQDRHLIFSINSGRSGSKYLAELLGTARDVKSFHEADPKMNGEFIDMINSKPIDQSRDARRIKSKAIAEILTASPPEQTYVETNHTFITTFYDVVMEDFRNIDIIILRRDLALILKSFIELGYFSPRNPLSLAWMSSPNAATGALPAIKPDAELDQFDLCIAYLLDIEARAERFKLEYPTARSHEVRLEELNDPAFVEKFFVRLQLTPTDATRDLCGQAVNERKQRKAKIDRSVTIDQCRERLREYVLKAETMGLNLPASPG